MSQKRRDELIAMMEQLEEDPIKPRDARYFDFYGVRGKPRGADPAENLRTTISLKARRMSCQLFSGFRGTGKTTELERLRAELEEQGFVVLFVKGAEVLHLHQPLNITDLLVSTAVGVAGEIERLIGQDPTTRSLVTKIVDFFKGTEVTSAELSAGIGAKVSHAPIEGQINLAQIKLQLSRSPAFKARIQGALRGRLPELLQQFGQFMRDVKTMLTPKLGGRSPILILDDLEKIRGTGPDSDIVQASMEEIFSQQDRALHIDGWHTVWTAPPYLQLMNSMMENLYDGSFVLPMVRLWERDEARSKDETGFSAIRQCLRKRGDINSLFFKEELFDALIWASSGHLRDLLGLIRDAVREAYKQSDPTVPLNEMQVHSIVDDYEAGCRNAVYDEDLPWLEKVSQTRALRIPDPKMLMRVAKLLDTAVIMTYRNGETWVDVSRPVQRLLARTSTESA